MKKSSKIAENVYEILQEKCRKEFEDSSWREWHVALKDRGIQSKGFDNSYDQIEELMRIVNDEKDDFVVCPDPWVNEKQFCEADGFLIIPTHIAEKIAILRGLP